MRFGAAALLLLAVSACDTSTPEIDPFSPELFDLSTLSQDPDALLGTWDLVAEVYFETIDGRPVVSRSSPGAEAWTFRADGTATRVQGDVVYDNSYQVARRVYDNGTRDTRASIRFGDEGESGEDFGIAGDVMILDRTPFDGPQSRYRRR